MKKSDVDYIFNCKTDNEMKAELDSVFADLGNENLIVNFVDEGSSTIDFEPNLDKNGINKNKKKSGGLSTGAIVGIIIGSLALITIIVLLIVCLKNRKIAIPQQSATRTEISSTSLDK